MLKLVSHFILIFFIIVFFGKLFLLPGLTFLYVYGLIVSGVLLITFFVSLFLYRDPAINKEIIGITKFPLVSLMVAVHNEEEIIDRCLLSLINQTYENFEIIVVDDASSDDTLNIINQYANDPRLKVISLEKNVGKKKALSEAILKSRGSIYFFTDSDSLVEKDAIKKIVHIFNTDLEIGAISGHCRALNPLESIWTRIQDSWYEGQFSVRKAFESVFGTVSCVSGPLAAFRKEAVYNYIPAWINDTFLGQEFKFATDRTMTGFVLGGTQVGKKLKEKYKDSVFIKNADFPEKDWKIVYSKSVKAWTNVPDTFSKIVKQQVRWKKSFIRNSFFTGSFFWRKPFIPALFYYLHILFVLVGPIIAVRHIVFLPLQGLWEASFLYIAGILVVGFSFGLAYKKENPDCNRWLYRPLMSLLSTFILSWLVYYSLVTIRKSIWSRG